MNTIKSFLIALSLAAAVQRMPAQSAAGPANAILPPAAAAARPVPAAEPAEVFSLQSEGGGFARIVGTNQILTLAHTNGAKLVLHFTRIEGTNIAYRWRSQSSPEAPIVTGESTLSEPYQRTAPPATTNSEVVPKGEPVPFRVFNAGGMRVVWVSKAALDRWKNPRDSGRSENRGQDTAKVAIFISAGLVSGGYGGVEEFDALLDTVPIEAYQPTSLHFPGGVTNH